MLLTASLLTAGAFRPTLPAGTALDARIEETARSASSALPEARLAISFFYEDVDLDQVDFEDSTGTTRFRDLQRLRRGLEIAYGPAFFRVYGEEYGDELLDGFGFGGGLRSTHALGDFGSGVTPLLDYQVGMEVGFFDWDDLNAAGVALDFAGRLGAGIGYRSLTLTGGLAASYVGGEIADPFSGTIEMESANLGAYVGAGFTPPDAGLRARIDAFFGDVQGVVVTLGYQF